MKKEIITTSRRGFLKALGLATTCAIVSGPLSLLETNPIQSEKFILITRFLKVTPEMQSDIPAMAAFFNRFGMQLSDNDIDWQSKTTIEVGFIGDDFTRNMPTVKMVYKKSV